MLTNNYYAMFKTAMMPYMSMGANATDYKGYKRTLYTTAYGSNVLRCDPIGGIVFAVETTTIGSNAPYPLTAKIDAIADDDYSNLRFGSGMTPPTLNDYKLESMITKNMTVVSAATEEAKIVDDTVTRTCSYILKNTGSVDVVIGEVGMFHTSYYSSNSTKTRFLIDRTVLDEPITIAPGGTGTVVYTLTFKCPTPPSE